MAVKNASNPGVIMTENGTVDVHQADTCKNRGLGRLCMRQVGSKLTSGTVIETVMRNGGRLLLVEGMRANMNE